MKTILAYGDSLAWGRDPTRRGKRHPASHRWPDVLQRELGPGHTVIFEGLRGRTTAFSLSQADCEINGASVLPTALYTHAPLDLMILMLGTNDPQSIICGRAIGPCRACDGRWNSPATRAAPAASRPSPKGAGRGPTTSGQVGGHLFSRGVR